MWIVLGVENGRRLFRKIEKGKVEEEEQGVCGGGEERWGRKRAILFYLGGKWEESLSQRRWISLYLIPPENIEAVNKVRSSLQSRLEESSDSR